MEDWMYYQRVSWSTYRHLFAPFRHALHKVSYRTVASTSYQRKDIYFDHFAIHYKVSYRSITCSTFKRIDICVYHFAILVHQKVAYMTVICTTFYLPVHHLQPPLCE